MTSKDTALRIAKGARRRGPFATIDEAVEAIRAGRMVVVVDDESRENEGDLTMAASKVTPEAINFMARHGRGLICLAMTPERLDQLAIPLEVNDNSSRRDTARSMHATTRRPASPQPIERKRCAWRSIRRRSRAISRDLDTCSPCAPGRAACSSGPGTPKPQLTSRV